jgi:C4-dicarboxylate-specific signal transduction histidine kinase
VPASSGNDFDHPAYRHLLARQKAPHLSELTLGLLHKFNNVFTGVMFLTEECVTKEGAGESVGGRLREILGLLQQAHTYIDRVTRLHLDDAEEDAGYHELDAVIADQLDLARLLLPRGTVLTHAPAGERLTFYASQRALCEILLHLFGNCGEALPKRGGAVTISSHADATGAGTVTVEIHDNGPGFSADALQQLFVSSCTTKDETHHAGLGLWRCRDLARTFGGDLTAGNHPTGGAVVTLTLPRDNSSSQP